MLVVSCGGSGARVSPARLKGNSSSGMSWNCSAVLTFIGGAVVADFIVKGLPWNPESKDFTRFSVR